MLSNITITKHPWKKLARIFTISAIIYIAWYTVYFPTTPEWATTKNSAQGNEWAKRRSQRSERMTAGMLFWSGSEAIKNYNPYSPCHLATFKWNQGIEAVFPLVHGKKKASAFALAFLMLVLWRRFLSLTNCSSFRGTYSHTLLTERVTVLANARCLYTTLHALTRFLLIRGLIRVKH